ncbi:MAG: hypothetical protein M1481_02140 [Candidatus Thermoplasmatota archaeon]|jgi:hypothetical protein|nr:hypothetical protein [Candidatus Thermoplasmatota archaeon]MCL5963601.1 hypothetical protein [Candidatus Thermoplasmatota archaeon]
MTFIWGLKKSNGTVHCYFRKTRCVNEKPNVAMDICLGTADKIIQENMGVEEKEIIKTLNIDALATN